MREIATESLALLTRIVPEALLARYPGLFCVETFASVVGMFELNNLEIAVASPVEDYFLAVDALDDARDTNAAATKRVTNPCWTRWTRRTTRRARAPASSRCRAA